MNTFMSSTVCALLRNPECPDSLLRDALIDEGFNVAKIYIVTGTTGEYSDHDTWTVAAYLLKEQADAEAERLNAWCKEHGMSDPPTASYEVRRTLKPPGDPQFHVDYTGTEYVVEDVELRA